MTNAEPSKSQPDTAAPSPSSPAERQMARLADAIQVKKAEIKKVLRRHADSIKAENEKVAAAEVVCRDTKLTVVGLEIKVDSLEKTVLELQAKLKDTEASLSITKLYLQSKAFDRDSLLNRLDVIKAARDEKLSEPNRHVAALQKDLEKLERRHALSKARQPLKALFPGSSEPGKAAAG